MSNPMAVARSSFLASLAGVVALFNNSVNAAGFYFPEVGTPSSLGTGGVSNTVNIYGADAVWTNPAGMTALEEDRIFAGLQVLAPKIEFSSSVADKGGKDGGNSGETALIPSFFYAKKFSERLYAGFSITVPIGGGVDYGDDFVGRYETISAYLEGIALSPSIGYEVNDAFSVGAGISFVYTLFEQDIAINPELAPTINGEDGKLKIEDADDWGYQPFIGATYKLSDQILIGLVYRAEMEVDLEGDVKYENLGEHTSLVDKVDVAWDNPQTLEAGLSYKFNQLKTLFFNAGWQDWSAFSNNELAFVGAGVAVLERNWKDTWHAGVGFSHLEEREGYSLGLSYESSPVDDEDRTFDLPVDDLYRLSASYSWNSLHKFDYSIGASLMVFGDTKIDNTVQGVRVKGDFDDNYLLFLGATMRYVF
ncbi:outer membrane protein transport protein [Neiella sp. HB171785]|uniref:Outer membrane protein transport protein n=1 Tax=Neiella litorisoli TaxID=2771431 RepID=A0A8J6QTT4_9GAMM|nr:outer membrane protein transport protein [Neiella litorisoli]MBD1389122.1 outer membrane protein transport protein [Neiella litorisoli]